MNVTPVVPHAPEPGPAVIQMELLSSYAAILRERRALSRFVWIQVFPARWTWFFRVPILGTVVSFLVLRHIGRVLGALEAAYQLRRATTEKGANCDQWRNLRKQVKVMKKALPDLSLKKSMLAVLAFVIVLLASAVLSKDDSSFLVDMVGAILTLQPEKFAELAAKPESLVTTLRWGAWALLMFIGGVPIIVCHFRFKRLLFNYRPTPSAVGPPVITVQQVWRERQTLFGSVYDIEHRLFQSLGETALHEVPLDLNAITIAFAYHAAGPGLFVAILALYVFPLNRTTGWMLMVVAGVNMLIGVTNVLLNMGKSRRRQTIDTKPSRG
jgi:hypothetical protein